MLIQSTKLTIGDEVRVGPFYVTVSDIRRTKNTVFYYWKDGDRTVHAGCSVDGKLVVRDKTES